MTARTLYDKIWDEHLVRTEADGTALLYIDRHLVHEVTSPQAFEGLRQAGRKVWRTSSVVATADHNTPTTGWERGYDGIADPISKEQIVTLDANLKNLGAAAYFPFMNQRQGIVHVIGPENGATLPGMTVVCGDSHTSTHGAFGALAHGIGTSEVEHVMATQTLLAKKAKNMLIKVNGKVAPGITAKDIVLAIIGRIGTAGGTGYTIEFAGEAIRDLSMEGRMTVCNMAIEAGARAGLVAVDDKTIAYVKGRPLAPTGVEWDQAVLYWKTLHSDADARWDAVVELNAADIVPQVTWGTISAASSRTTASKCASASECSVFQYCTAWSHSAPVGDRGRPLTYSMVLSSTATSPARAPASMAMLQTVMRPSMDRPRTAEPPNSMA